MTYLRDRLLVARELLTATGSLFVQISDEHIHQVRELLDEVFGEENFVSQIAFQKTGGQSAKRLGSICDFLLWYGKDAVRTYYRAPYVYQPYPDPDDPNYVFIDDDHGEPTRLTPKQRANRSLIPEGKRIFRFGPITSDGASNSPQAFTFDDETFNPPKNQHWKTTVEGMSNLARRGRILRSGKGLAYKLYWDDFPAVPLANIWLDTQSGGFNEPKLYVVQTTNKVIQRCILMTTEPGDLVLDPTCGGGTTAVVAEQWGRRWITIDTSRIPIALARQRLLTATFPYYRLKDEVRGPGSGFQYERRKNRKGQEIGGIIPHITLKSIAVGEPPAEEILPDRPEGDRSVTRVTGPFVLEATIPTPVDWEGDGEEDSGAAEDHAPFVDRMLAFLRQSPVLRLPDNRELKLTNIRPPARALVLSAEAMVDATEGGKATLSDAIEVADEKSKGKLPLSDKPVAIVFGPENGAVSEKLVYEAAREAYAKSYSRLLVFGLGIEPNARKLVEDCANAVGVPAIYIQVTPDVVMGDLLKTMRTSQIFSVCGLPEVELFKTKDGLYQARLLGLDVFDPISMEADHRAGTDVPAWFLDTDYNGLCFHVSQAFFPRTSAWDNIKKSLVETYDEAVWDHLAGDISAPFEAGQSGKIAVKVIDDRGNELMVVKALAEARPIKRAAE